MLILRQSWMLFLCCAGVYSIRYEEDSNATTVQSRQLQSGFFPSDFNQNDNYNGNYNNANNNENYYNYNYNYNTNSQPQGGGLQFPDKDTQNPGSVNYQDNSIFNTGEHYSGDQQSQYQSGFNDVKPLNIPNRENNDVQYFAYQESPTFPNTKPPITSYYQQNIPFTPNLQNPPPPQRVTQRPIGPFYRPQRPLGTVNNIPQPTGFYQQNYAGDYNNYQTTSNPISNFISNIGQGAADFFNGGQNSNYFNGPNPPPQFDSFNRPIRPQGFGNRPPPSPFGTIEQLGKAIDEITRNDDFQCIPKVICQMFGNQRQQNSFSSILGSPIFSGLIAAVPSSSTGLIYGRAALLGYTSGESTCNGAYPKCPKHEDDLLYYLNNHRGGFFRFFNGGASFGDDSNYNYNHNQQNNQFNQNYNQQQNTPQQSSLGNLAALQNLADAINQSDGINLSNIASNGGLLNNLAGLVGGNGGGTVDLLSSLIGSNSDASSGGASGILNSLIAGGGGGGTPSGANNGGAISLLTGLAQNAGSNANLGSVVGNLLTGFIGNRFSSRKISKRSVDEDAIDKVNNENPSTGKIDLNLDRKNASTDGNQTEDAVDIQPRIVHGKLPILSESNDQSNSHIKFTENVETTYRDEKKIKFNDNDDDRKKPFFIFPVNDISPHNENVIFPTTNNVFRLSKKIKFQRIESEPQFFPTSDDHQSLNEIKNETPQRIKMVFPETDRTGTGNLIFDNNKFETESTRIGKILTGLRVLQQLQEHQLNGNNNRIHFDATNGNRYDSNSQFNANPLYGLTQSNDGYQQSFANRYTTNQQANNHRFGNQNYNINYNSQSNYNAAHGGGDSSQNVYVTNGKGVVEYYINSAGVKVYV
ncbi:hypothetical protein Bhyg_13853 [Pseudolycoriella hygida]|uniref:Uncharacterized protein n=1 Tax=Pseudolycoriella hygida TaxID=35572 RepID=A0A9Q0MNM2_9DIPT|nr:hypothetical protein Bhyg_13853 [Pseudolycoriella hygida]